MSSLFRDISYLLSSRFVTIGLAFVLNIFLVNMMSLEEYGSYAIVVSFVSLFQTVSDLGFGESTRYFVAKYASNKRLLLRYLNTGLRILFVLGLLSSFIVVLLSDSLSSFYKVERFLFLASAVYVFAATVFNTLIIIFEGLGRFKELSLISIFFTIARFSSIILLLFNFRALGAVLGETLASILSLLLSLFLMRDLISFRFKKADLKKVFATGKTMSDLASKYLVATFLSSFINNISNLALGVFSLSFTAIFNIASKFSMILGSFGSNASVAFFPRLVKKLESGESVSHYLLIYVKYTLIFSLLLSIVFIAFSKDVVVFLFSEKSVGTVDVLPFLFLAMSFDSSFFIIHVLIHASKKPLYGLYLTAFKGLVTIIAFSFLIPSFFAVGAGIGTLIVSVLSSCFTVFFAKKKMNVSIDLKSLLAIFFFGCVLVWSSYVIIDYSFVIKILLTGLSSFLFLVLLFVFRQLKFSELEPFVKEFLKRNRA